MHDYMTPMSGAPAVSSRNLRIVIVDDHQLLLEAVRDRLNAHHGFEVVGTATDTDAGLLAVLESKPDVVLVDVDLPGRGIFDMVTDLKTRLRQTKVIFVSGFMSDVFIEHALRSKASGYLIKGEPLQTLISAIERAVAGEQVFSPSVLERLNFDTARNRYVLKTTLPTAGLTTRQLEVLRHLAKGESVKEVARVMHLSQKSVDSHKYRIMNKLGIHDRVELTRFAIREGMITP